LGRIPKEPWVDELQRANECADPLGLHALQLLLELSDDAVNDLQQEDSVISLLRSWLDLDYEPSLDELHQLPPDGRKLWSLRSTLAVVNQVLVRKSEGTYQLIVPNALKRRLFDRAHAGPLAAHLGFDRTLAQLRDSYYWPDMSKDVRVWCNACDVCARSKGPPPRARGELVKVIAAAPMDLVAVDVLSGLRQSDDGSTCMLVAVDYMTKWAEAYALPNEEASTCMNALYNGFFSRFGMPNQLHSDQGRNFESKLFGELTKLAGIRRTMTTPFHPRSDGQTERMNRTILGMLRATAYDNPGDWPEKLPAIMAAYRMTPHSTTGVTPNYAMLAREVRLPCSLIATSPEKTQNLIPYNIHFRDNVRAAHERVRNATNRSSKTQKSYFDTRVKAISLTKGQLVWLYWPKPLLRQQKRKLTQLLFGSYRITNFKSEVVVEVHTLKQIKHKLCMLTDSCLARLSPKLRVPELRLRTPSCRLRRRW